ncbi:MAG: phage holin family protein [Bacteroidales bacterium]|jgi:putative membrane protein|nr:phage holin family protein [Bacteroidales bacterium]
MKEYKVNFNSGNFSPKQKSFWTKVLIMALAIFITSLLFSIAEANPLSAVAAAIMISVLNAFLRPILTMVSLPLIVMSLGLFYLVINALIILMTSAIIPGFSVNGFGDAILFSIIVTLISYVLEMPAKYRRQKKELEPKDETKFTSYEDVTEEEEDK